MRITSAIVSLQVHGALCRNPPIRGRPGRTNLSHLYDAAEPTRERHLASGLRSGPETPLSVLEPA